MRNNYSLYSKKIADLEKNLHIGIHFNLDHVSYLITDSPNWMITCSSDIVMNVALLSWWVDCILEELQNPLIVTHADRESPRKAPPVQGSNLRL